jgi:hypothetical protein
MISNDFHSLNAMDSVPLFGNDDFKPNRCTCCARSGFEPSIGEPLYDTMRVLKIRLQDFELALERRLPL